MRAGNRLRGVKAQWGGVINYLILEVPIPLKLSAVVVNNHHPLLTETKGLVRRLRGRTS